MSILKYECLVKAGWSKKATSKEKEKLFNAAENFTTTKEPITQELYNLAKLILTR